MNKRLQDFTLPLALAALVVGPALKAGAAALPGTAPTYAAGQGLTTNGGSNMVVQADLNGDGRAELASANHNAGTVSILLGPAFTTLTSPLAVPANASSSPFYLAVGDFNKDGKPDLITANRQDNSISILLNTTTPYFVSTSPTFTATVIPIPTASGARPECVAVADVNNDTKLDIVTANFQANSVTVFFGDGLGGITAGATKTYPVPFLAPASASNPTAVAFGDLNRDGRPDLVAAANVNSQIDVYLNNGTADPYSAAPTPYNTGANPGTLAIADLNGDLSPDVVVSPNGGGAGTPVISVFFGNGDGTLGTAPCGDASICGPGKRLDLPGVGSGAQGVVVGDMNGDSYPDIAVVDDLHGPSDGVKVFLGNGLGCFGNTASAGTPPPCGTWLPVVLVPGTQPSGIGLGDVTGDSKPDLFVANAGAAGPAGITLFSNTLPGATACAASVSPPTCITNRVPCATIDVNLSNLVLPGAAAVRGFSATLRLSSNLQLCTAPAPSSFTEGDYLSLSGVGSARLTEFHVTSNADGSLTVDDVILDPVSPPTVCGPVALSGKLFSVRVTSTAGTIGTGTVSVTGLTLRDCANGPLTAFACPSNPASGTVTIKRVDPLAATALTQAQRKTGNGTGQVTAINVGWTLPSDANSPATTTRVEIYRAPFLGTGGTAQLSGYPDYQGTPPAAPVSYPPTAPWVLAGSVPAGASQLSNFPDTPPIRGYWYYVVYRVDQCNAISTPLGPPAPTAGTLNYHIADVAKPGGGICAGDNAVNVLNDFGAFSSFYGAGVAVGAPAIGLLDPKACYDFGPTTSGTIDGRPLRDLKINLEDLILWSISLPTVPPLSGPGLAAAMAPSDHDGITLDAPAEVRAGDTFTVRVQLEADGALQGLSAQLAWDPSIAEPIAVEPGEMATSQSAVVLSAQPGGVDAAVMGSDRTGFSGHGILATVRFRARANGEPALEVASIDGRDRTNHKVFVSGARQPGDLTTAFAPVSPNPFREAAALVFTLGHEGRADLAIYSVDGRRIRTLASGTRPAGAYRLAWDGKDDAGRATMPGLYFARLLTPSGKFSRTLVRIR